MKAIIEMTAKTKYKYESFYKELSVGMFYDKVYFLKLDRILNQPVPYNYGFIPDTLAPDGDPKDIFVISSEPLLPLSEVEVEIIGEFICEDNGIEDNKLVGVLKGEDRTLLFNKDVLEQYLTTYKDGFIVKEFFYRE